MAKPLTHAQAKALTTPEALARLRAIVDQYPSHLAASKGLGVSNSFLADVLRGSTPISQRLAEAIGLEREMIFKETQ